MGKSRRKHTAKTGDKKLYQSRNAPTDDHRSSDPVEEEDPMYDSVDRFHQNRDFIQFDNDDDDDSSDDGLGREEAVMDIGGDEEGNDDDDDDDGDSDSNDEKEVPLEDESEQEEEPMPSSSDDDDDGDDNDEPDDVRDWGRKKSAYYHGDTADLEIGQDEEDAFVEEEAAKEVQAARYKQMTEDDFVLSDTDDDDDDNRHQSDHDVTVSANLAKLSTKERKKLLEKQHPELLPLLSHFSEIVQDLQSKTWVATHAVFDGETGTAESIGTTKQGQQYLLTKSLLQSSAALNFAMYMLLKAEYASNNDKNVDPSLIQNHPVLLHLQKTNALMQRLEENVENKVDGLKEQLDNLAKAALLMNQPQESSDHDGEDSSESDEESESEEILQDQDQSMEPVHESGASTSESESDDSDNELKVRRKVLTEARFGLRPNEIVTDANIPRKRRRAIDSDAGDHDIRDETQQKAVSRALATTLNSIEQRAESRKRKSARDDVERIDEIDDDRELRRGLAMMESELGKGSDEEEDDQSKEAGGDFGDDLDKDNDFYDQIQKKSKAKKEFRTELYRVAPKFPRVEEEIVGERAISKQILKNRGLVAHKAKINRNPRVKKREQYRKALIRRKGAVREVRTDEGHKYGGEETGIKTSLSRSRKLAR